MGVNPARDMLSKHGLRCTSQRETIYAALMASKVHPTAEELHSAVNRVDTDGGISLATVYNALKSFTDAGIVRRIAPTRGGSDAAFRYDADISNHAHVVRADGSMQDLPEELSRRIISHIPPEIMAEVERRMGLRVGRIGVEFMEQAGDVG